MSAPDTIAAPATPPGRGAIAIVRVSGPSVRQIAARVVPGAPLRPRHAHYTAILDEDGSAIDRGLALFSAAPNSYTGEHTLELHVHGSPVVVREVLRAILASGARLAQPGEFTRRAFMNGKLDLHAASAVADLIDAETRSAARAALANLGGGLASDVRRLRAVLATIVEDCSGAIDFPQEIPDPDRSRVDADLSSIVDELVQLRRDGEVGRLVREGITVAIVGPPNAGKSSLLNALLGEDRALVSEIAGTTRDTIEESLSIDGVRVRLVDTAGIRR
ncbi:MAG: tRNA uridine-5-carboxymethylaminomethyl(34) synthesis GTPase MnmE, partial [Candidatus Baltobacteraceae bacterium]